MKEYLDLLPESKKSEIRRARQVRQIITQEFSFLFPILIFIGILIAINFIVRIQSAAVEAIYENEQKREENEELKRYENKFAEVNSKLATIDAIQAFHLNWTTVLSQIEELMPDGVYLTGMSTKDYKVYLAGKAATRDALLALQEALNGSGCFTGVNVPYSNLVSEKDVDFQIDLSVNSECLTDEKYVLEKK